MDEEFKSQEHIDALRRRLYARNGNSAAPARHNLSEKKVDVARDWSTYEKPSRHAEPKVNQEPQTQRDEDREPELPVEQQIQPEEQASTESPIKKRRPYRLYVIVGSLLIFVIAAALSSAYLYIGGNQISSENIGLSISGPSTIGGGENLSLQVALSNQNSVSLESVTLIVKYPQGTRTSEEPIENLFEERIWLDKLEPGEVKNIPIKATIFGEEGDEKTINATLEYRVTGSNGTFYKDAEALNLQVSTSPIVLQVKSVDKVASGQEVEVVIEVKSNTSSSFKNLLVSASYPSGFSYKSSDPEPTFGQNVWRIDELNSEETKTIKVKGVISGLTEEALRFNVSAGPAQPDNQFIVDTVINESYTEFVIERPFLDVEVKVNGSVNDEIVLFPNQSASVQIEINNTLRESVYDMYIEVVPTGNAFKDDQVTPGRGFYDSNTGIIKWEVSNFPQFSQVLPGDTRTVGFAIMPGPAQSTATFDLTANVYGRRIAEPNAQEQLIGTFAIKAKYASELQLSSQANIVSGPVPPKVGETSTYAVAILAGAGVNDVNNAVVRTTLPVYVNWLDDYATEGRVSYNSISHELIWEVGSIDSGKQKELVFTVNILPSSSQVGIKPVLVNKQTLEAVDSFTGSPIDTDSKLITTELSRDAGYSQGNGEVVQN